MKAQLKCSSCGAEITNLNMSWGKKQWLWFIPLIVFMIFIPFIMDSWFKDSNDFRSDLSIKDIEKRYINGNLEIFGIIDNHGKVNWENIVVEAELFENNGKFLDEIRGSICTNLSPNSSEHFKISSKEFPESRWNLISESKVKVSDAYHSKF